MSELDGIKQGIEQVRNEVAQAKLASEQAQSVAADKVNELAMLGLEGVAQVLQTVADTMNTAVSQLGTGYTATDECVSGLKVVTDKTKMSETAAALDAASEKLAATGAEVDGAGAQASDALTHAQESEVEPVMNAVAAAISAIDQAKAAIEATKVKTGEYRSKIDQAGRGLLTSTTGGLTATIGSPLQPPQGGPDDTSAHRAELKSSDDEDSQMSRFRRFSRAAVRNADSLHAQGKDTAKTGYDFADGWVDPYGPNIVTETAQTGRHQPTIQGKLADDSPQDAVGSFIVLSAAFIEGISRWFKHRSGRQSE